MVLNVKCAAFEKFQTVGKYVLRYVISNRKGKKLRGKKIQ